MPRLFTYSHRERFKRDASDPKYHGNEAETVYLQGMSLLSTVKILRQLISARRQQNAPIKPGRNVQYQRRKRMKQAALLQHEHRSTPALIKQFKEATEQLSILRSRYELLHMQRHRGLPPEYRVTVRGVQHFRGDKERADEHYAHYCAKFGQDAVKITAC